MYKNSSSPFDYLIWNGKTLLGIEAKQMSERKSGNPKSIPFSRLSEDQEKGLTHFSSFDNTLPLIGFNWRWCNHQKGETYIMKIEEFKNLKENINRKSIPIEWFRKNGNRIDRKGSGWDINKMYEVYKEA